MGSRSRLAATAIGMTLALLMGRGSAASPNTNKDIQDKIDAEAKEQRSARANAAECRSVKDTVGPIPGWFVERCMDVQKGTEVSSLLPNASRGPILVQEVATNTVDTTSVAGIATLTSFGALVPASGTDFPADFVRVPADTQRVYQITAAGAVSRYSTGGVNTVLPSILPASGSQWSDTATDPTTGTVYAAALAGTTTCTSTLSTINFAASTSVLVGSITGGGCIISLAADNAGNLWGIDLTGTTNSLLVSINKVTGVGTVVGSIGFDTSFGQGFDCDPSSGICYMFTINVTAANAAELRSVNTATGATTLLGTIGSTSPGGATQVAGAVFETISDTCAIDADCADGNLCNGVETCVATVCVPGTPVVCPNDGLFCTLDTCVPANGLCGVPNTCSDGDTCTVDACDEANDICTHSSPAPVVFCSTGVISIRDATSALPYPSTIAVSGLGSSAALCSVQLLGMNHTWPGDIDILLAGPVAPSQNAVIMSDVGGGTDLVGVNLTLKDSAATSMTTAAIVSGTYKPTNLGVTDAFPAPAPATTGGSSLTAFAGNPNGTWSLYVADDTGTDSGTLTQWCVSIVPTSCSTNADCGDGNPCTDDACVNTACTHTNNTAACSDGNACTLNDACSGGVCVGGTAQVCNDADACTTDTCNTGTGQCQFPAIVCNDTNTCTDDTCNPQTGCVFTPNNNNACTDNNLCTTPDVCQNGVCVGQSPVVCNPDANPCTTEACDPATGLCASTGNTNACDDGDVCTTGDVCGPDPNGVAYEEFDGVTAPSLPAGWTTAVTGTGSLWTTVSTSSDTPPNSAFAVDGATVSDEVLVSPVINIATATAKVSFQNRWSFESATSCFDAGVLEIKIGAGAFTQIPSGSFASGGYTGTVSASFSNPLAGRAAWCNISAGYPAYLTTLVNLPATAAGQAIQLRWRVGTDTSAVGVGQNIDSIVLYDNPNTCTPGAGTLNCADTNPCTDDFCAAGCQHANNVDPCDDSNACTIIDTCSNGACGGTAIVCDDSNPCTADSCSTTLGCIFTPITVPPETQTFGAAADEVTFTWAPQASATRYDVVRGLVSALPVGPGGGDEFCFDNLPTATLTDATLPGDGAAFWYLSRGENTCGNGTYGNQGVNGAPGAPRVTATCP